MSKPNEQIELTFNIKANVYQIVELEGINREEFLEGLNNGSICTTIAHSVNDTSDIVMADGDGWRKVGEVVNQSTDESDMTDFFLLEDDQEIVEEVDEPALETEE